MRLVGAFLITLGAFAQTPVPSPFATGAGGGGSGTVTSVGLAGTANQITVTGATPITSSGSWTLSIPTSPTLPGTTTGTFSGNLTGNVTGNLTGAVTGNASTATALAANPTNCSAGNYPLGIDASGNVENCTAVTATTPASPANSVQFNNAGAFGGSADFTWDPLNGLVMNTTSTATTEVAGMQITRIWNPSGAPGSASVFGIKSYSASDAFNAQNLFSIKGFDIVAEHDGSGTLTALGAGDCDAENYGTALVSIIWGCRGIADNNAGGAVTDLMGLRSLFGADGGTVANAYGLKIDEIGGSGVITTNYGVYSPDFTQGTTTYGFYSAQSSGSGKWAFYGAGTAASRLGGELEIVGLKTTGAATGKKVVCVDTATGQLYASTSDTQCLN